MSGGCTIPTGWKGDQQSMRPHSALSDSSQESYSLGELLGRAHYSMRRRLNRRMAGSGIELTGEQCMILLVPGCESKLIQQDLADRLFKDKTGISRLVSTMERKGLIQRTSTVEDRRNNFLELTDYGHSMVSRSKSMIS